MDVAWPGGALVDVAWWCVAPGKLVLAMREWMQLGGTRADVAAWRRAAPVGRGLAARSSGLPPPHRSGCRLGSEDTCRSVFGVPLRVAGTTRCPGRPSGQAVIDELCRTLNLGSILDLQQREDQCGLVRLVARAARVSLQ